MTQLGDLTGLMLAVIAISLLPFVAMVVTSYAKIVVVLGLLRNAMGVQQVPPNMVLNGIAILVSIYVMAPIGSKAMEVLQQNNGRETNPTQLTIDVLGAACEPFREFLIKHTPQREKQFFLHAARSVWPEDMAAKLNENDLIVLAPSFTLSEMTDAFRIGFVLYIAFLVVDLVIANILLAMGLNQVQPVNVAIPFKLLLFVLMDGWSTLMHGLVMTYR